MGVEEELRQGKPHVLIAKMSNTSRSESEAAQAELMGGRTIKYATMESPRRTVWFQRVQKKDVNGLHSASSGG